MVVPIEDDVSTRAGNGIEDRGVQWLTEDDQVLSDTWTGRLVSQLTRIERLGGRQGTDCGELDFEQPATQLPSMNSTRQSRFQGVSLTGVNDVHRAHGAASIVENPLLLSAQILLANLVLQLSDDEVNNGARILAMSLDSTLRQIMQVLGIENVELVEARVEEAVQGREQGQENREEAQVLEREAATAAAGGGVFVGRRFGRHRDVAGSEGRFGEDEVGCCDAWRTLGLEIQIEFIDGRPLASRAPAKPAKPIGLCPRHVGSTQSESPPL